MIDITEERLQPVPVALAAMHINKSKATRHRWVTVGVRGAVLETVFVGGIKHTSSEAVGRFLERLNSGHSRSNSGSGRRSDRARRMASERAARELAARGA
jgi:hypothetical protein